MTSFIVIYGNRPPVLLVVVLKEFMATDGNHGDECHELLEVTFGVAVSVQALHQAVKRRLVFDVLQGRTGEFTSGQTKSECLAGRRAFRPNCDQIQTKIQKVLYTLLVGSPQNFVPGSNQR